MKYSVTFNHVSYNLPKYNFDIADKLKDVSQTNDSFHERCRKEYELENELLGGDKLKGILGEFEEADPNEIDMLFNEIMMAYESPKVDQTMKSITKRLDATGLNKLTDMAGNIDKLSRLANKG